MKIIEIHIGAFGSLKDFNLTLGDSLNVVYADNEGGKSTILAFIKAMFYGTGRKARNEMGVREKYTPWDSSVMGGSIIFEHGGSKYRLERQFRSSDSTDHITLCDLATNMQIACEKDFAVKLFGIGQAAFERSLYIGVNPHFEEDAEASGEFDLKLSNITQTADESVSLTAVQKRILSAKGKLVSKTGKAGPLAELKRELEDLENRHKKSLQDEERRIEKAQQIENLKGELAAKKQSLHQAQSDKNRATAAKDAKKLAEYISSLEQKQELENALRLKDGKPLTSAFINAVSFGLQKFSDKQTKYNQHKAQSETLKQMCDECSNADGRDLEKEKADCLNEIKQLDALCGELQQKADFPRKQRKVHPVFFSLFGIFMLVCLGLIFGLNNVFLGSVSGAAAVIFAVLGIILSVSFNAALKQSLALSRQLDETAQKLSLCQERLDITDTLINAQKEKEKREQEYQAKLAEMEELTAKIQKDSADVLAYFGRYKEVNSPFDIENEIEILKEKLDAQRENTTRLNMLTLDFGDMPLDTARERLSLARDGDETQIDTEQTQAQIESLTDDINLIEKEIVRLSSELKAEFSGCENPAAVNKAKIMTAAAVKSQDEFCDECDTALEVLDEAFREMRKSYGDVLQNKTLEIFSHLTDNRYDAVSVSKSFDMTVRQQGDFISRQSDFLSRGTQDQLYLSLRLSLAQFISENEALPVFLDDALSQFDDKRTKTALSFLKNDLSNQVLLFTCHSFVADCASSLGSDVKKI